MRMPTVVRAERALPSGDNLGHAVLTWVNLIRDTAAQI